MNISKRRIASLTLFLGDIAALYIGLFGALLLKYEPEELSWAWQLHIPPFSVVFALWILIFFIAGLYEKHAWSGSSTIRERIIRSTAAAIIFAVILFYLVPSFGITPKTNLLIQSVISGALIIGWRMIFGSIVTRASKTHIAFFGVSHEILAFAEWLNANPHLGYKACFVIQAKEEPLPNTTHIPVLHVSSAIKEEITRQRISLVVGSKDVRSHTAFVQMLYDILPLGVTFTDFAKFYESLTGKVPVSLISEMWFLENISEKEKRTLEIVKRGMDIGFSVILGIATLVIFPFVAFLIAIDSRGPILLRQTRTGKNGIPFTLYKFRSMIASNPDGSAETQGAEWARDNDARITRVGKILRKTRIDELPQLLNVLRGELSFIGPRPERPELISQLQTEIPFYNIRHLVRPGLSGWAQINFPYGSSVKDAMEKLQYDLYYIKNRSLVLDAVIALKTILVMLSGEGK